MQHNHDKFENGVPVIHLDCNTSKHYFQLIPLHTYIHIGNHPTIQGQ